MREISATTTGLTKNGGNISLLKRPLLILLAGLIFGLMVFAGLALSAGWWFMPDRVYDVSGSQVKQDQASSLLEIADLVMTEGVVAQGVAHISGGLEVQYYLRASCATSILPAFLKQPGFARLELKTVAQPRDWDPHKHLKWWRPDLAAKCREGDFVNEGLWVAVVLDESAAEQVTVYLTISTM